MTSKEQRQAVINLYHQFCKEHNVTPQTIYANVLLKWPEYLHSHGF